MRRIFVAAVLLLAAVAVQAQPRTNKIQVFDQSPKKTGKGRNSGNDESSRFLIKLNPGLLLNGEFPVYYEQRLWKALAFEGALGFTRRDYIGPQGEIVNFLTQEDVADIMTRDRNSTAGTGFVTKAGLRLYLEGEDEFPEGMYIAGEVRYKTHVYNYTEPDNSSRPGEISKLTDNFTDIVGIMGRQYELADNLLFDSYSGIGMRFKKIGVMDGVVDTNNGNFVYTKRVISSSSPLFSVGFKLGYYF